jgi:2-methylcitrate dehydratase PrpD
MRYGLKFYSSAASTQTALDALRNIQKKHSFKADEVDKIMVYGGQVMMEHTYWKYEPSGLTNAQFNMPFVIATLLLAGDVFVDEFTEESIRDPKRIAFSEKVIFIHDPEVTAMGPKHRYIARVEVHLNDGKVLKDRVEAQRGSEQCFASDDEVFAKFENLASRVLNKRQVEIIRSSVMTVEKLGNVADLVKVLRATPVAMRARKQVELEPAK